MENHRYGDHHVALRKHYEAEVLAGTVKCAERECIMPSRHIERWHDWDLAHDHVAGGDDDYLGPAHRLCNEAEALRRGASWPGAPTLEQLMMWAQASPPERVYFYDVWLERGGDPDANPYPPPEGRTNETHSL